MPHAPQFITSMVRSAQTPEQQLRPVPHVGDDPQRHSPLTHVSPAPHAGMQPATIMQVPPMHVSPAGQGRPHPPQCISSVATVRHAESQHISPGEHAGMHADTGTHPPATHI